MLNRREMRTWRVAVAAVLFVVLASGCSMGTPPPPTPDAMIRMIADHEGVKTSQVELLASEFKVGEPYALYRIAPPFSPRPPNEDMWLRVFVHPPLQEWIIAGGSAAVSLHAGEGASMSLSTTKGDTGSRINTEIFGVGGPGAASIAVTIDGQTYTRDIRDGRGYIILLEQQGVRLSMIDDVRVYGSDGNLLPVPLLWRGFLEGGPVLDIEAP